MDVTWFIIDMVKSCIFLITSVKNVILHYLMIIDFFIKLETKFKKPFIFFYFFFFATFDDQKYFINDGILKISQLITIILFFLF